MGVAGDGLDDAPGVNQHSIQADGQATSGKFTGDLVRGRDIRHQHHMPQQRLGHVLGGFCYLHQFVGPTEK